jgi:competence protein ComEA
VTSPGVVELPEGARADDAVRAAAGFRPEADTAAVNLAAPVADGAQLHVPAVGELPASVGAPGTSAFGRLAAGQPAAAAVTGPSTAGASGVVNVNQATAAELESLPGIGPALAQRIVDYRMANGPFARIEDLTAVSGIGERTLEKLRDRIVVR